LSFLRNTLRQLRYLKAIGLGNYLIWTGARRLGRQATISAVIGGQRLRLRTHTDDLIIAMHCLNGEFRSLAHLLPKNYDGLVVDAGGYIGAAAIAFSRMYPEARIVTIEPSLENFAVLSENVQPIASITAINAALVGPGIASVKLFNRRRQDGFTTVEHPADNPAPELLGEVRAISLGEIRALFPDKELRLLKLDIEGGEKALFEQPESGLAEIEFIFVELHDRILPGCEQAFRKFSEMRIVLNFGGEKYLSVFRGR
jgi:FkbM family methyltransferase